MNAQELDALDRNRVPLSEHTITAHETQGIARGGTQASFTKAACSCGEWEEAFETANETRRAEARQSAKEHLAAAAEAGPTIQKCDSCGVAIEFVRHENTGKHAPLELNPIGDLEIVKNEANRKRYRKAATEDLLRLRAEGRAYVNHFATCPNAGAHHKTTAATRG